MWELARQLLVERFRVVRLDLRGYGNTPLPPGPYSNADDVVRLLDTLGIERASFVGSSYGGRVALDLVMLRPDLVSKLVRIASGIRDWEWTERTKAAWTEEEELWESGDLDAADRGECPNVGLSGTRRSEVLDLVRTMQRHAVEVQNAAEQADEPPGPDDAASAPRRRGSTRARSSLRGLRDLPDFVQIAHMLAPRASRTRRSWRSTRLHLPNLERPEETTKLLLDLISSRSVRSASSQKEERGRRRPRSELLPRGRLFLLFFQAAPAASGPRSTQVTIVDRPSLHLSPILG